jgi:hypothetical protein
MAPTIFIAIPSHDGRVHLACMAGCMQTLTEFPGSIRVDGEIGSLLPRNRDILTQRFLDSGCSHMLCVDTDIGWKAGDLRRLLDTDKWFVSGVYCKKQLDREIPAEFMGETQGDLARCVFVPGGFLLLSRQAVVAMADQYCERRYETQYGKVTSLWVQGHVGTSYDGEDVGFCRGWTAMGGEIWMHMGVVVQHWGSLAYLPKAP